MTVDNEDSFTSDDWKCPVTGMSTIDDCHIEIQFGYGSDMDMWTFKFSSVNDVVGKKVLEVIQSLMSEGKSVDDFGKDTLAGLEAPECNRPDRDSGHAGFYDHDEVIDGDDGD